jgi:MFS family permease
MTVLDAATVHRRFVLLTALRWLPLGFFLPVTVVLMQQRGLSLAEVGIVSTVQGLTVIALELPTGGLADALGRRPVLVVASLFDLLSIALFAVAQDLTTFALAWFVQGIYRALESGPLESWFVDASLSADREADIEGGLSRAGRMLGVAIAAGSLGAGGLTLLPPIGSVDPLLLPVLASLALRLVDLIAIATLVTEDRPGAGLAALGQSLRAVPGIVGTTLGLLRSGGALLALATVELLWGAGMTGVELFAAPRMVDLLADARTGVATFAVAAALGWSVSGLGAGLTPRLIFLLGGRPALAGAVLRIAQGAGVALIAVIAGPAGLVAGYLGFYLVHGASNVVHYGMVHRLVGPEQRATMVSVNSLTSRVGGALSAVILGVVADRAGIPAAWIVCAVLLAAAAPLYLAAERKVASPAAQVPSTGT